MKGIIKYLSDNLGTIVIALVLGYVFNHIGHCYQTTSQYDCNIERDYYTFDLFGFILDALGFYILLSIGKGFGKSEMKERIIKKMYEDDFMNNAENISSSFNFKNQERKEWCDLNNEKYEEHEFNHEELSPGMYEAVWRFFLHKIEKA
ncbi:MAG TPA: hypothetical protein VNW29_05725 [Candidatus Sulfotelmatobacter sp.]|jgi:hypothetical protein|nr:hypothetical protein [Candidatus Sulfotelmatobacter sp.]